ncbi:altronate dehydratase family protein [Brachybacterium phenoliresistens]|uniref:UxaA family hydrolase n=1 Tax=Brachybacterium phenoliresistens TaxID=396014 RepID=UPI0031DFEF04
MTGTPAAALRLLHAGDHVAIALRDIAAGEQLAVDGQDLNVATDVPRGHKVAVLARANGEPVEKYGHVIGTATAPIAPGDHVHSHNLTFSAHAATSAAQAGSTGSWTPPELPERRTFLGIRREDGRVATRNHIAIVASVNCSATVVKAIADRVERAGILPDTVDGVLPLAHDLGCGMAPSGEGMDILRRTILGYADHPNVGGVLAIGLGCEVNQMEQLFAEFETGPHRPARDLPLVRMTIQDSGGTRATIAKGIEAIEAMLPRVADVRREEVPVSELVLGLNCGGSDGWSGITANPALGHASDLIVAQGGTSVLAETPEIYGAEDLLVERATDPRVAQDLLDVIAWWEKYTESTGASMDNNPSPGNKEGGITTILEKSLGAVAKGGHAPLAAVYRYAEKIDTRGFGFMDTPGYDPVSVTGLVAGGANLVCFTTGRGSALGSRPAPTLKVATNSDLYRRMGDDMDIDAGEMVEHDVSIEEKGLEIYHALLDLASGTQSASEELGYGLEEFIPWHIGAVM